jgi:hypothetical protein
VAEHLVELSPFAVQRRKPIRRFIMAMLKWANWHDEVFADNRQTALFDFLYPYYRKNRREGYYPLPKSVLRKWNGHHEELMPWLERIGFLTPAPYGYSSLLGISRYYAINREPFLEKCGHIFNNNRDAGEVRHIFNNRSPGGGFS